MKKFVYDIDKLTSMQNRALDILANLRTNLINIADKIEEINNELGDHQES